MLTVEDLNTTGGDGNGGSVGGHRFILDSVAGIAEDSGFRAYLVGGPVRDSLLGTSTTDLDITVIGDATAVAARLAEEIDGRLTVHQRFGTATVTYGLLTIDLVTARRETYRSPGALPDVEPGDIGDDLARRDFTINAMAMPLFGSAAEPVDPHGGRADLDAGVIRVLHAGSFRDDPTRILRAVRYAARFGFRIEPATAGLMSEALGARALATLSGDRLRHELERTLEEADPAPSLRLADDCGVLQAVHPALTAEHLAGAGGERPTPLTWLAALVWPLSADEGAALSARLNAPSDWTRVIADMARIRGMVPALCTDGEDGLKPSDVCALLDGLAPDALRGAIMTAGGGAADRIGRYLNEWWSVAPRLRGNDLLVLGVPAGPAVGEALRELRKARLDGVTRTVQDEEDLAQRWAEVSNKIAC
jgi:tRNA nucleotidyltransferase (CCA-adding enzyme)